MKKAIFLSLFGLGIFLMVQVLMPILSYQFWEATQYRENQALVSPNPNSQVLGISIKNQDNFPAIVSDIKREDKPYNTFTLSIPTLKLQNLNVVVDTNNFEENLAHLSGSALPGERGNVFITGHSSLPQLFKPSNYKAIFSNLSKIKKGDTIEVRVGGQYLEYKVKGLKIIDPNDVSVVSPPDKSGRYLTLMTCVPPGLYTKRLIVLAELLI